MINFTLTYAEAALIAVSIALVAMVVAYLRNDHLWCTRFRELQTRCRVEHQGWTMCTSGIMRGMAIPPPPPMPPTKTRNEIAAAAGKSVRKAIARNA